MTEISQKPVRIWDYDDTLVNHVNVFSDWLLTEKGIHVPPHAYTENFAKMLDCSDEESDVIAEEFHNSGALAACVPLPGAVEAVALSAETHTNIIATSRRPASGTVTLRSVEELFGDTISDVLFSGLFNEGSRTGKNRSKIELYLGLNAVSIRDDMPKHCRPALAAGIGDVVLFGDYTWHNDGLPIDPAIERVSSWATSQHAA